MKRPVGSLDRARKRRRRGRLVVALSSVLLVPGLVRDANADVVLHEYLPPDPAEDLEFHATTNAGTMAAAIKTQTGPVRAPDPDRDTDRNGTVYGAGPEEGPGGSFHIDADTRRPDSVSYDDPFTPSLAPYKREFAYDTVSDGFDLVVRDSALTRLDIGGAPRPEDDQFYADLDVDLTPSEAVRIPTAGPSARLLAVRTVPETTISAFHDSAGDWFVRGDREGRVRLVLHIAVDRAVFGSPFADVEWPRLWRFAPPVPDHVKTEGVRVARQIGVVDGTGPSEALGILVRYFRGFAPSTELPKSSGAGLYRELSISKKGVCRHRAYAFVVTALALGIPSRFVRNEAHAWVEVFDGTRWHRIDLGGAAGEIQSNDASKVAHVPPRDPYDWPPGSESGQAMAARSRATQASSGYGNGPLDQNSGQKSAPTDFETKSDVSPPEAEDDTRPHSNVTLHVQDPSGRRGERVAIAGQVDVAGSPCVETRVDLFLDPTSGESKGRLALGTLVTNAQGHYEGRVVVPYDVAPGDYEVCATTPGNSSCGTGKSK